MRRRTPEFVVRSPAPIGELLRTGTARLRAAGIGVAALESRLLLGHALGATQEGLLRDPAAIVDARGFAAVLARREAREPLALILGRREFWSLGFAVSPATLIPRPESETLIEAALAIWPDRAAVGRVLDLGTGTGCLLLAALTEFASAFGVGVDRSAAAAALAAGNAAALGLAGRASVIAADWAAPLAGRFDLVLCNPPYIPRGELVSLMPEVARFEPAVALDGGRDGLDAYRRVLPALPGLLAPRGRAVLELGAGQEVPVVALAGAADLAVAAVRPDLSGIPRALVLAAAEKPFGSAAMAS